MERQQQGPRDHRRSNEGKKQNYPRADAVAPGESDDRDDSGVGITNTPMRDHRNTPRSRYTGHGRDTEGAFGEEDVPPERPLSQP